MRRLLIVEFDGAAAAAAASVHENICAMHTYNNLDDNNLKPHT